MLDLFATASNAKLPLYVSPIPDKRAEGVDVLSRNWKGLDYCPYPPTRILSLVLRKVREEPCRMLLIAPAWPNQIWFPDLLDYHRFELC